MQSSPRPSSPCPLLRLAGPPLQAAAIHGDISQGARTAAVEAFKSGEVPLLVATDVVGAGGAGGGAGAVGLGCAGLGCACLTDDPEESILRAGWTRCPVLTLLAAGFATAVQAARGLDIPDVEVRT